MNTPQVTFLSVFLLVACDDSDNTGDFEGAGNGTGLDSADESAGLDSADNSTADEGTPASMGSGAGEGPGDPSGTVGEQNPDVTGNGVTMTDSDGDSDGGGDDDGDDGGPALASLSASVAQALCAAWEGCGDTPRLTGYSDGDPCEATMQARLDDGFLRGLEAVVADGRVGYDPSDAAKCLADIRALGCDVGSTRWQDLCGAALQGTAGMGEACKADLDCAGEAFCDHGDPPTCPGACTARAATGTSCGQYGDATCFSGFVCAVVGADAQECQLPVGEGGECGEGLPPCGEGLECFATGQGDDSEVCKLSSQVYTGDRGDACDPLTGQLCTRAPGSRLACSMATSTCEPVKMADEACAPAMPDPCPPEQYCDAASNACTPRGGAGRACEPAQSKACAHGHACLSARIDGVDGHYCLALAEIGDDCMIDRQCYSAVCDGGQCSAPVTCD